VRPAQISSGSHEVHRRQENGLVEGTVAGDLFTFKQLNGPLEGQLTVSGDEMTGLASALLWEPRSMPERTNKDHLRAADVAAQTLGVRLQVVEVRGPADFDKAFADMTRAHADAVAVLGSTMIITERRRLVDLAAKHRLPAMYTWRWFVDAGGLMAYGPNVADIFRRTASYVDKILKGAKPADLPVEQPTKFELVINLKTAKALGLTIPQSLLIRADEISQ
jgi:putative ABC transport system substrate-binding protein